MLRCHLDYRVGILILRNPGGLACLWWRFLGSGTEVFDSLALPVFWAK